ncbi:hypothetical protein ABZ926_34155 [Streptomyces litmocidini]|uniref:Uncharacterized protein n=1 Tax=Streptomyces litmocidini TaxID=67318 RepID=A0ABW7UHJ9_9ACTN|nr:hypothetical protein [Streptomyces sp. PanSC19]ROQ33465.1 hypothetical protein EDD98_2493 [Streptomyces sp. PanSC19]
MRLDLPKQVPAVDRREHYPPYRIVVTFVDVDGTLQRVHKQPRGNFGPLPSDPRPLGHDYGRGWQCAPTGCRWTGVL